MAVYYTSLAPDANAEVWKEGKQPAGYVTAEAWQAANPVQMPEPVLPSMGELLLAKLSEINAKYEAAIAYLKSPYPDMSLIFWDRQCQEAREYLADNTAPAMYIRELSAAKGLEVGELASRILAYEEDWAPIGGRLEGQRQLYEEAALEAETPEDIAAITVSYNF